MSKQVLQYKGNGHREQGSLWREWYKVERFELLDCLYHEPHREHRFHCYNPKLLRLLKSGRWIKSETPVILCVIHHRQNPIESTSIVACVFVAAGTCLPSRCLETALVYMPTSQSLHSSSYARYNVLVSVVQYINS
jgi:hypothetical protein